MKLLARLLRRISELMRAAPKPEVKTDTATRETLPEKLRPETRPAGAQTPPAMTPAETTTPKAPPSQPQRNPYFVQVGFDFGTSSCKCVCRDITTQQAWIYVPEAPANSVYPFLLPSAMWIREGSVSIADPNAQYHENGLPYAKTALAACAREAWDDPSLQPYLDAVDHNKERLKTFMPACAVYLLAGYLGEVRKKIRERHRGFGDHPDDHVMVNLAVPVADAQQSHVESLFMRVLERAFENADALAGHPALSVEVLEQYSRGIAEDSVASGNSGPCFVYPEVSANVQSFVRSPTAQSGIYFFCDTGAASVDLSVFIFVRFPNQPNTLNYLSARVLPLGSSRIEQKAMAIKGEDGAERLEYWRLRKENGDYNPALRDAKYCIGLALRQETVGLLFQAKNQLYMPKQFENMQALFGGGGHVQYPYEKYALDAFADPSLIVTRPVANNLDRRPFRPRDVGLPTPDDLALQPKHWYKRLTVAYGLSYFKGDLTEYKFPDAGGHEKIIGMPTRDIPPAPGPEVC